MSRIIGSEALESDTVIKEILIPAQNGTRGLMYTAYIGLIVTLTFLPMISAIRKMYEMKMSSWVSQ